MRARTFEIKYSLKGEIKEASYNAITGTVALRTLLNGMTRRQRLFFKLIKVSMI